MTPGLQTADVTVGEAPSFTLPGASGVLSRVIVVGSDASEPSDAPVAVAAALMEEREAKPHVVSVLLPLPGVIAPIDHGLVAVPAAQHDRSRLERRHREIEAQLEPHRGEGTSWPVTVGIGEPAAQIMEEAVRRNAALIMLGLRRHRVLEHLFRENVALQVMRHAPVPTLGVVESLRRLPRRIVVAVDFSRASLEAARAAMAVVARRGELLLTHVAYSPPPAAEDFEGEYLVDQLGVREAFERFHATLAPPATLRVTPTIIEGTAPGVALLDLAARSGSELIAIGGHRRSEVERVFLGSVTQVVAREAACSVLVAHAAGAPPAG